MNLPPLTQTFVLHFGEMGSKWGLSRTVGQIYALLFLSAEPLNADSITEQLGVSRSNVSMGLKELQSWNLVRLLHKPGDRRDYFTTPEDLWVILRTLVEERKKREVDPTLSMLRSVLMESPGSGPDSHAQDRMREMHDLIEMLDGWYGDIRTMETERLIALIKLGGRISQMLGVAERFMDNPFGRPEPATGAAAEPNIDPKGIAPSSSPSSSTSPSDKKEPPR